MSTLPECALTSCVAQAYAAGCALHGNLGLAIGDYSARIKQIVEKYL